MDFTNQTASIVNDCGIREVLKKYLIVWAQEMIEGCFPKRPHLCANITIYEKKIILNNFKVLYYLTHKAAFKLLEPEMREWSSWLPL